MNILTRLLRRFIALAYLIGPFAAPAEAQSPQDHLWTAINAQDVDELRAAVAEGANVNAPNAEGRVPLYRAIVLQRQPLVDALLELGADANATDHRGDPLLIIAMSVGSAKTNLYVSPGVRKMVALPAVSSTIGFALGVVRSASLYVFCFVLVPDA